MNKSILYERIKQRRLQLGLSQDELAEATGYKNRSAIARIENGSIDLPQSKIVAMANALKTTPGWLMGADVNAIKTTRIPLYSHISCGFGLFIDDQPEDYITIPNRYIKPNRTYFANIAEGDSMEGKGIQDGDVLIFEQTSQVQNGQIGSFCLDWETNVCKIFRILPNKMVMLESANDKYEPILVDVSQECFRCIGKLIATFKKY